MKKINLTAILAAATVAALTTAAAAEHRRPAQAWTKLGEVGTHEADAEDYVPVSPARRYDTIVIRARDGVVPLDGVKITYADGRVTQPFLHQVLRPGEQVSIDVSEHMPIEMVKLDYNERDRRWGYRGDARVEVFGQTVARNDRYRGERYRGTRYDRDRADRTIYDRNDQARYEWRGGVELRID